MTQEPIASPTAQIAAIGQGSDRSADRSYQVHQTDVVTPSTLLAVLKQQQHKLAAAAVHHERLEHFVRNVTEEALLGVEHGRQHRWQDHICAEFDSVCQQMGIECFKTTPAGQTWCHCIH